MYENIREEELKNKISQEYFPNFDTTKIIGNIDFCVTLKRDKKGIADIFNSITQLILTVSTYFKNTALKREKSYKICKLHPNKTLTK
ncbi:MAG: hypothetical protein EAZ97_12255 [Bacteroidetes bacterium]|nr:MAG: hypothetical protein EAZ97_12255 [Bacteroidota bacterium]